MNLDQVHETFSYNPNTGSVYRKITTSSVAMAGQKVGSNERGYLTVYHQGAKRRLHHIAWILHTGRPPRGEIDHINRVKSDNRAENLREVSRQENCRNFPTPSNNTSGVKGVSWSKAQAKWKSTIYDGKSIHLGFFADFDEAVAARKSAEKELGYR